MNRESEREKMKGNMKGGRKRKKWRGWTRKKMNREELKSEGTEKNKFVVHQH